MSAGWVAGSVRARLLTNRRMGPDGCRRMAAAPPAEAVAMLAASPYRHDVDASMSPLVAAHRAGRTTVWHLRVLAGWLTAAGAETVRVLAGGFEIANVEARRDRLADDAAAPVEPYELGGLAVAWPRVASASSPAELRSMLAATPWGDPGADTGPALAVGLRLAWARRVADGVAGAAGWAESAAALLVARERSVFDRPLEPGAEANACRLIGRRWLDERWSTPDELSRLVPPSARQLLAGIDASDRLWEAERAWWHEVARDARGVLRRGGDGAEVVAAAVALLLVDLWQVQAALEACIWGPPGREAFDAVA